MRLYLAASGIRLLHQLTGTELKRHLGELQDRGLSPDTVHGHFATLRAFAGWAARENHPVDTSFFRVRPAQGAQREMETYSEVQLERILEAAPEGSPRLAILILLGTGMRVGELCALTVDDIEDEGEAAFFKDQAGQGRQVQAGACQPPARSRTDPLPQPGSAADLSLPSSCSARTASRVWLETVTELLKRITRRFGFRVHAHRFRHALATEYLRQGGEIERLRRFSVTRPTPWSCATSISTKGPLPRLRHTRALLTVWWDTSSAYCVGDHCIVAADGAECRLGIGRARDLHLRGGQS